jgi:hypothetical protein
MSRRRPRTRQFAVMWDCMGLEAVKEIPDPALATWARLQDKKPEPPPNLMHWQLRARYNLQRHYEIYILTTDTKITEECIRDWFRDSPQAAADLVRERGVKFHSDRATSKAVIR